MANSNMLSLKTHRFESLRKANHMLHKSTRLNAQQGPYLGYFVSKLQKHARKTLSHKNI